MQWTILGAGAVGSLFATHLLRIGQKVNLLDTRQAHRQQSCPMTLALLDSSSFTCELPCIGYQDLSQIGCLLVTTKVWQVIPALQPLVGGLPESCPVILLHNGMGTTEWLVEHFPHNPLLAGVTSCGALKKIAITSATPALVKPGWGHLIRQENNGKRWCRHWLKRWGMPGGVNRSVNGNGASWWLTPSLIL